MQSAVSALKMMFVNLRMCCNLFLYRSYQGNLSLLKFIRTYFLSICGKPLATVPFWGNKALFISLHSIQKQQFISCVTNIQGDNSHKKIRGDYRPYEKVIHGEMIHWVLLTIGFCLLSWDFFIFRRDSPYDVAVFHPKHKGSTLASLPDGR